MYLCFKRGTSYQCSSKLNCISWKQDQDDGWLATGNKMSGLGITSLGTSAESKLATANFTDHFSEVSDNIMHRGVGSRGALDAIGTPVFTVILQRKFFTTKLS